MNLTYIKQAGEPNGDAGDQYTGLDRFGRVVDQRWPQGEDELERVDYGFTAASNRQWRQNLVAATGQDEYYNYDGLYQVAELNRGTLNGTKTAITGTPSWTEDFTYDPIGNWDAYLTKVSGVTDLDQTRTHNTANETTEIDGSSTTVAHDLAGNMVKVPQVADWEATNELTWDAWNRLVEVVDGETTVAQYRYDGKTRRVSKEVDAVRHYYYSDQWQVVEERVDSETAAERQFVWGQRYLDDLVLRDRDVDHDGSLDERLYVLSDYFNPTAIADEDGVVVERYGYNAFGLSRVMDADFEPRSTSDYDWETRYGAYRWDGETGFYQVRYRYLHPTLGRWLSKDPAGESAGTNLFAYVFNSAIDLVDLFGLYSLFFDESFSPTEKLLVQKTFDEVTKWLPDFVTFIESKRNEFADDICGCCPYKDEFLASIDQLLTRMRSQLRAMQGTIRLTLKKTNEPGIAAQVMFDKNDNPIWEVQFSTDPKLGFFTSTHKERIGTIFHELSHYEGLQDQDVPWLENAHNVEGMFKAKPFTWDPVPEQQFYRKYKLKKPCPRKSEDHSG